MKGNRAEYGKQVVESLSGQLTRKYGKGFSPQNLWYMVQLFDAYPILHSMRGEFKNLSWTHIRTLLPIKDNLKRNFYAALCQLEKWNTRTLSERINSMLYERTALSKLPEKTIESQLKELTEKDKMTPELVFRDPYVLDFLELHNSYSERDLENAILNALEKFILEFGKDFYFVERQKRITLDDDDFYIDLVFYHRRLKCFVIIELKLGKFKAEYKGKMELYLRYMEKYEMKISSYYLEKIRDQIWSGKEYGNVGLMIGSGFSRNAERRSLNVPKFPLWKDLVDQMYKELDPTRSKLQSLARKT